MSSKSETTKLDNSTYNILKALGIEADFLYSTVDKYIEDARKDRRDQLVDTWNEIKKDKQKHLDKLRQCLEQEAKQEKLGQ
jgi:hypothetical protein